MARLGGKNNLLDNGLGLGRMFFQIISESLAHRAGYSAGDFAVAELCLRLPLELGFHHLYGDNRGEAVAEVVTGNLHLCVLEQVVVLGVFLQRCSEGTAETHQMCATLYRVDVVYEGIDILVGGGVVCESHFHGYASTLGIEVNHIVDERLLVGVDILHKFAQALAGVEALAARLALGVHLPQVGECEGDSRIQERQVAQAVGENRVVVDSDSEY